MKVRLTNTSGAVLAVPPPFDVTLAIAGTKDMTVFMRDIVEYRANPARVDFLREIEQMVKSARLTIVPLSRDVNSFDLEDMLQVGGGGAWNQKGYVPVAAPAPNVAVVFPQPMPNTNYRVRSVILEGVAGAQPFEISAIATTGFLVTFAAPWGAGTLHWEIEVMA